MTPVDKKCLSPQEEKNIASLWKKGTDFLGVSYSILCGAMSWISNHQLVSAISEAGGFGILAGGALSPEQLCFEIRETKKKTSQPFGVNLIVFHPHFQDLLEVCLGEKVSHVFLGGGFPKKETLDYLRKNNVKTVGFAPSLAIGKRLVSFGIDALVLEGHEAGGHVGPTSTTVLCQEILGNLEVPLFVAGGIGHGKAILSYLFMGASGCQLGTRFSCALESCAHPRFKEAFFRSQGKDATVSGSIDSRFHVIPVRSLNNEGKKEFIHFQQTMIDALKKGELSLKEAQEKVEFFWSGALRRAVMEGDVTHGSLMAGQSVSFVTKEESCGDILQTLIKEMQESYDHVFSFFRS